MIKNCTNDKKNILERINSRLSASNLDEQEARVKEIIQAIKANGDKALAEYSRKFDTHEIDLNSKNPFQVQIDTRGKPRFYNLAKDLQEVLLNAQKRISKFHQNEIKKLGYQKGWSFRGELGEKLGVKYSPLDSVAVYVPGGQAPLISTCLMTAIPAIIAGVRRIVLVSPPPINSNILACAELLGIEEVYSIGGAQAIAALAYGTESIRAVDKIVGPGNIYVALAKKQVFGDIGIDGVFGPSELAIIADTSANPLHIACDLMSQLEHGSGLESVLLLSTCANLIEQVENLIENQLVDLAGKNIKTSAQIDTIRKSLKDWSALIKVKDLNEACELINYYAPEHLELQLTKAHTQEALQLIKNAGAIFMGSNSCESLGDYMAGPSHCLPTGRSARFSSGLQCADFLKKTSVIDFSNCRTQSSRFQKLKKQVALFARAERLEMHARAMEARE